MAIGHRGQRHRRAWMAAVGLLDTIHRQGANGIDCQLLNVGRLFGHGSFLLDAYVDG